MSLPDQSELQREAYGPEGDPAQHLSLSELRRGLAQLKPESATDGTLAMIVIRHADGHREEPDEAMLDEIRGLVGDGWERRPPRDPQAQLAVTRRAVAELVANGQNANMAGDNLFVDMDLSTPGMPIGTRLQIDEAVVEVTPKPHNGCAKYAERFGHDALRFVNEAENRQHNLRGIYWRVIKSGRIRRWAAIRALG